VFIKAKDDGGGGDHWTTGAISRAKLPSNHHHQQTNIQFFYRPDAHPVAQPTVSKHRREKFADVFAAVENTEHQNIRVLQPKPFNVVHSLNLWLGGDHVVKLDISGA